jgi:glycosyltransferase involved in cell wall biosynthesis
VILPSYAEAYPTVLLEAAACGTPFLASNIAGIPDIVEESGGGRVFEVGNVSMLAEVIDEILTDEVKWLEMSKNGKRWVKTLSEEKIKRQWLNVYNLLDQQSLTSTPERPVNWE